MKPIITTTNLCVSYRVENSFVRALADIDMSILPGEVCCLLGPSGSGKSTLLNQLAGLEKPTRGQVLFNSVDITQLNERQLTKIRRGNMSFIFQSFNLLAQLTAVENVALPLTFRRIPKAARLHIAHKELNKLGMASHSRHLPNQLSGGQQQRVGIARAFITRPKVIFADEPTGNLDSLTTTKVMETMLFRCKGQGITLLMVTHEQNLALCADHIIRMRDGKVVDEVRFSSAEVEANRAHLLKMCSLEGESN